MVLTINTVVFALVGLLHLWRALGGYDANIGNITLPVWGSWIGLLVAIVLVWLNWNAMKK